MVTDVSVASKVTHSLFTNYQLSAKYETQVFQSCLSSTKICELRIVKFLKQEHQILHGAIASLT